MLEVIDLEVRYGSIAAVKGIRFSVAPGALATLLGANGAGKSSTLLAIAGALPVAKGKILFDGVDVTGKKPEQMVQAGLAMVPETRDVFPDLTVDENLRLGAYTRLRDKSGVASDRERLFALFPRLQERKEQAAGTLSGGEQQMLVIARAMMARPKVLLLDEPSLGLAPVVVDQLFAMIAELKALGTTILLVEQNATKALQVADSAFVLRQGKIATEGRASDIAARQDLNALYLGGGM